MIDGIINGRVTSRQQLVQMLRDVCTNAAALSGRDLIGSGRWPDRAEAAIKSCIALQRGLIASHPLLADELHILATEIQIALAAQSHDALFAARIEKIQAAVRRVQQSNLEGSQTS
jgi:hypothetical protein